MMGDDDMKKLFLGIALISVVLLTGCNTKDSEINNNGTNTDGNNETGNVSSGDNDKQQSADGTVFENDDVIVKLNYLDETHDYSMFSGESVHKNIHNPYFYNMVEYGKVNIIEEDGKVLVQISTDSTIESCTAKSDVISMLLKTPTYPGYDYNVLNIDIASKKILSIDEFIQSSNVDLEKLKSDVKQIEYNLIKDFCDKEIEAGYTSDVNDFELYRSIDYFEENFDFSGAEFYYNEEGNLSFNFESYVILIGGGPVHFVYDLEAEKLTHIIAGY